MRWIEPEVEYAVGDKRIVKRFLWLPTKPMFSREWRWLEHAYIEQKWLEGYVTKFWCNMSWRDDREDS